jgi:hypothetical protein
LVEENRDALAEFEDAGPFWLGLAATQWSIGRLLPKICDRAISIIESGEDLRRWEEHPKLLDSRKKVLQKLLEQLNSPTPAPKKIAPRYRATCDWKIGSVRSFRLKSGNYCLFQVINHFSDRGGVTPVVQFFDWVGPMIPTEKEFRLLRVKKTIGRAENSTFILGSIGKRDLPSHRLQLLDLERPSSIRSEGEVCFLWKYIDRHLYERLGFE